MRSEKNVSKIDANNTTEKKLRRVFGGFNQTTNIVPIYPY